ncbi:hypothetical protein CY35_05G092900 [Sphagnum magellanicum]|nr:hypothetical protein CY35_05G092900 [Sphagnum magellanicum]
MSAHKTWRVINQICGRSYEQALMPLELMPYRTRHPILQLLSSATTNASCNSNLNKINLIRFQPRTQGHVYPIHKLTCHITITMKNGKWMIR